ncbi:MAG: hypothetical protein GXO78_14595 [Calditrichaeota bacterium]|nr:hypothetical protein [Calditrichota bacterium]
MKNSWIKLSIFAVVGGALGFAYYYFIGCRTGSCPLSSNPYIMTGYGVFTGLVIGWNRDLFRRKRKE